MDPSQGTNFRDEIVFKIWHDGYLANTPMGFASAKVAMFSLSKNQRMDLDVFLNLKHVGTLTIDSKFYSAEEEDYI